MKKEKIFYYDFVRVIAFLVIIVFHFNISVNIRGISNFQILRNEFANLNLAAIGVPLFFCLSGDVLARFYEYGNVLIFYLKRVKAIFPLFYLSYILVLFYYFMKYKTIHPFVVPDNKWTFLLTILGMDGYTSSFLTNYYLIGEWFLGCIIIMYLLFPLLYLLVDKCRFVGWLPVIGIYLIVYWFHIFCTLPTQNVFIRLPEFLFGIYMGRYCKKVKIVPASVCAIVAMMIIFIPLNTIPEIYLITILGCSAYVVIVYIGQIINQRTFMYLFANVSQYTYSIYLVHHVISEQIISTFEGRILTNIEILILFLIVLLFDFLGGIFVYKLYISIRTFAENLVEKSKAMNSN